MSQYFNQVSYGFSQPLITEAPVPVVALRAPTTNDIKWPLGQLWIQPKNTSGTPENLAWVLTSIINNSATWLQIETSGGPGVFSSLIVNPGPTSLSTIGNGNVTIGNTSNTGLISIVAGTGNFSLSGAAGSTITIGTGVTTGNISLAAAQTTGTLNLGGTGAATGTISLGVGTGLQTIDIGTGGTAAKTIAIGTGAIGNNITIGNITTGTVLNLRSGGTPTGMVINDLDGLVAVTPVVVSSASTTPTNDTRVGIVTVTGLTTAAAGTQVVTITNTEVVTTSGILISAYNLNASGNAAAIAIQSTVVGTGSIKVTLVNNGVGALGAGDNVTITFWVIS